MTSFFVIKMISYIWMIHTHTHTFYVFIRLFESDYKPINKRRKILLPFFFNPINWMLLDSLSKVALLIGHGEKSANNFSASKFSVIFPESPCFLKSLFLPNIWLGLFMK